jgi:hypothetical protein
MLWLIQTRVYTSSIIERKFASLNTCWLYDSSVQRFDYFLVALMEGHYSNIAQRMIKKEENIACLAAGDLKQPDHTSISFAQYVPDGWCRVAERTEQKLVNNIDPLMQAGSKSWSLYLNSYRPHPFRSFMNNRLPLTNQLLITSTDGCSAIQATIQLPNGWSMSYRRLYACRNRASINSRIHCLKISNLIFFYFTISDVLISVSVEYLHNVSDAPFRSPKLREIVMVSTEMEVRAVGCRLCSNLAI